MKKATTILATLLLVMAGCGSDQQAANDLITVDVTKDYPKKELILQDFMNVEYIPLETSDEFITQGDVMAIGNTYIVVKNYTNDGNIYFFDRQTGKGIRKINKKGQGAEEYAFINGIVLDEDREEMFVNSSSMKKIFVYDLSGNFKRSFNHTEGAEYLDVFNYDEDNLIRYDMSVYYKEGEKRDKGFYHAVISKQDGSVTRTIPIPFDIVKAPFIQKGDGVAVTSIRPIIPWQENWLLVETSSDTVYSYAPEKNKLRPFLVKKPTVNPEILLTMGPVTDRYCFMRTIEKVFDFTTGRGFPFTDLMYDKQENAVFNAEVMNADYSNKQTVDLTSHAGNSEVATFQNLAAYQLVEAYKKDVLKGKLKEIAAKLDEEANPVIMLVKYKK